MAGPCIRRLPVDCLTDSKPTIVQGWQDAFSQAPFAEPSDLLGRQNSKNVGPIWTHGKRFEFLIEI